MAALTLVELRALVESLSFNDNLKVVLLVGKTSDDKYQIVQVDADGKLVTTS